MNEVHTIQTEPLASFSTGAVRSQDKNGFRYDLVSPHSMKRLARVFDLGSKKYGDFNWEKGMPIGDILNHALAHIYAYLEGEQTGEDDLAHAAWNLLAALHMEEVHHRDIDHRLRPNHPLTKYADRGAAWPDGVHPALIWVIRTVNQ